MYRTSISPPELLDQLKICGLCWSMQGGKQLTRRATLSYIQLNSINLPDCWLQSNRSPACTGCCAQTAKPAVIRYAAPHRHQPLTHAGLPVSITSPGPEAVTTEWSKQQEPWLSGASWGRQWHLKALDSQSSSSEQQRCC